MDVYKGDDIIDGDIKYKECLFHISKRKNSNEKNKKETKIEAPTTQTLWN